MRTDWVEKLLNGSGEFTADKSNKTAAPVYTPFMPTSGSVDVDVVKPDGSASETISKNYDAYGNIVDKMNAAGAVDGVTAVNMLREYILIRPMMVTTVRTAQICSSDRMQHGMLMSW